jgi:TonB family protein
MLLAHVEGVVILEAVIDTEGHVTNARVLRSVNPVLDRAATNAVLRWRYTPALVGSRNVSVYLTVTLNFQINR